jgi:hypothetical protein
VFGTEFFLVDPQGEFQLAQQAGNRTGADVHIGVSKLRDDIGGGLAHPAQAGDGVPGGVVLQQLFDGLD